jgi:hypothetical protein
MSSAGGADVPSFGMFALRGGRVHVERRLHRDRERRDVGATPTVDSGLSTFDY